jgi:two-component system, sporulation sensor kinase E
MYELLKCSPKEIRHRTLGDLSTGEIPYTQREASQWIRKAAGGEPQIFEWTFKYKNHLFWGKVNLKHLEFDGNICLVGIVHDITELKKAEETRRLLDKRFSQVFNSSPNAMVITTLKEGRHIDINNSFSRIYGYSRNEIIGRTVSELNIWCNLEDRTKMIQKLIKHGSIQNEEFCYYTKSGEKRVALCSQVIIELNGEQCILSEENDITERKQAEKDLKDSEARYRELVTSVPVVVCKMAPDGTLLFANDTIYKITGYSSNELPLEKFYDILYPGELKQQVEELRQKIHTRDITDIEMNMIVKDGSVKTLSWKISNKYKPDGSLESSFAFGINITERKKLEKRMARLDQFDLIGEMAAGISHEIRNPLTTVRGFLQLLSEKEIYLLYKDYFDLMITELDRANGIITDFLSLAKNRKVNLQMLNLNSIVESIIPLIQASAAVNDQNVYLKLGKVPNLLLDKEEIIQLILNLARNGLEAMSPGGNLTISTYTNGQEVVLLVIDEGHGIDSEFIDKIGTPFFTTKKNGTGIGLTICYSIAVHHKATIDFSTGSTGTTFFVRFKQH